MIVVRGAAALAEYSMLEVSKSIDPIVMMTSYPLRPDYT
jgi:hypothetical protein